MKVYTELCGRCESCIAVCPLHLIEKKGWSVTIREGCTNCGECAEVCPVGALEPDEE